MLDPNMDDVVLMLNRARNSDDRRAVQWNAKAAELLGCENGVGGTRLVFESQEDETFSGPGSLADDDLPRRLNQTPARNRLQLFG